MENYIKHYLWFVKESYSFMGGFKWSSLTKAFKHAKSMCAWDKLTSEQKENWYLSGEDRTMYF